MMSLDNYFPNSSSKSAQLGLCPRDTGTGSHDRWEERRADEVFGGDGYADEGSEGDGYGGDGAPERPSTSTLVCPLAPPYSA